MRMPGRAPSAEPVWEAMAEELNPLGEPFRHGAVEFPPGEWVKVPERVAKQIEMFGWASVRPKGGD